MPTINISGKTFSYVLVRKSVRSLSLRLESNRSFVVTSPRLIPDFMITRFINTHQSWIVKNSSKFSSKKQLKNLNSLSIFNQDYEIIIKLSGRDSVVIFKDDRRIYINTLSLSESHLKKLIDAKFRPLALTLINTEIKNLSDKYHFNYGRISVKNTTSRFGSCSSANNLNFNWQIILFPIEIFHHILLHELTHTIHHNHSSAFWKQLAVFDPKWRLNRLYLKTKGQKHFIV